MSALDKQVAGNHYSDMAIQPAEFIIKNKISFCEGNVIKYVCRHKAKNGIEDLKKARHYLDMLIEAAELEDKIEQPEVDPLEFHTEFLAATTEG